MTDETTQQETKPAAQSVETPKTETTEKKTAPAQKKEDTVKENTAEKKETTDKTKENTKEKPKETKPVVKKDEAKAYGRNLHISKKHGMYICQFIKNKKIDEAISDLHQVTLQKKIVPFKGEVPHKKGKGMMSGRYPVKAAGMFINILKGLKGNSIVNGLDLDKTVIAQASTNWARRPMRTNRRQGKRSHVMIYARELEAKK